MIRSGAAASSPRATGVIDLRRRRVRKHRSKQSHQLHQRAGLTGNEFTDLDSSSMADRRLTERTVPGGD